MPIHLQEINVHQLGPISQLHLQPGRLNLIYGHNERGKTHLVEFLIRTLFGNEDWALRSEIGQGRVTVTGLNGHKTVSFTSTQPDKLTNYLENNLSNGLPLHLDHLLVVKAGDLRLTQKNQPLDKSFLRTYLSGQNTLETIASKISPTIANAEVKDGMIFGAKRGELKTRNQLKNKIDKIEDIIHDVDQHYSTANIQLLKQALEKIHQDIQNQEQARIVERFRIKNQIEQLNASLKAIPDHLIAKLENGLITHQINQRDIEQKKQKLHAAEKNSIHYSWLKHAATTWQEVQPNNDVKPSKNMLLYLSLIFIVSGVLMSFFIDPILSAIFSLAGIILGVLHINQKPPVPQRHSELDMIANEYRNRFKEPLPDIATLLAKKEALEVDYFSAQNLEKDIRDKQHQLSLLEKEIEHHFLSLKVNSLDPDEWQSALDQIKNRSNSIKQEIKQFEQAYIQLGASDILPDPSTPNPEVTYNPLVLKDLQAEQTFLENQIHEEERLLENLKQRVCDLTNAPFSTAWERLIENLRGLHQEAIRDYQEISARILAGIALHETLEKLRETEEDKIRSGLESDRFLKPLHQMTNRYQHIYFDGNQIIVGDSYADYPLAELSTGAQEQVLLALRLGFAAKALKTDQLFLILDDAFQHTDWERRENMIKEMVALAQKGWQIFYFTMDDHLRDRFISYGSEAFGSEFKSIDLNQFSAKYE